MKLQRNNDIEIYETEKERLTLLEPPTFTARQVKKKAGEDVETPWGKAHAENGMFVVTNDVTGDSFITTENDLKSNYKEVS